MSESSEIHTGWIQPPLQQKLSIQKSHAPAPTANGEPGCIAATSLPRFPFNGRAKILVIMSQTHSHCSFKENWFSCDKDLGPSDMYDSCAHWHLMILLAHEAFFIPFQTQNTLEMVEQEE